MANASMIVALMPKYVLPRKYSGLCTVKKDVSDITYKRTCAALARLSDYGDDRPQLHHVLFGKAEPRFSDPKASVSKGYFNSSLNRAQKAAVSKALSAREIALIHGPPGTGKTHTLIEIIRQLVGQGKRLLVCGASNISVDNIALRLANVPGLPFVRYGNPARMMSSVIKHSLYAKQEKVRKGKANGVSLKRMSEKAARKAIFSSTSVVLSTLCGSGDDRLTEYCPKFDVVVIDEASQAIEGECWIAAIQAEKLILAGDHHQLPPTVLSMGRSNRRTTASAAPDVNDAGPDLKLLEVSMFERVRSILGEKVSVMLTTQYRMHKLIMRVSSNLLYENKLVPVPKVANHLLCDLQNIQRNTVTESALVLIDTAKMNCSAEGTSAPKEVYLPGRDDPIILGSSKTNKTEVSLVSKHVERLVSYGTKPTDIAVITPYAGQVRLLRLEIGKRHPGIAIGTVDGFQGLEKEAVILSLVRSNSNRMIGFLKDYRRINVAITRARRHLCIVANTKTVVEQSKFLDSLVQHMHRHATKLSK
ncbi:hypothetical protein EV175_001009 [Coemansia sp. RSA 1933]|nr:hypothetical protein EV175_001009 [Coemansia sp. RSA 1933]